MSEDIAGLLDALCASIGDYHELSSQLMENPCSDEDDLNLKIQCAIDYDRDYVQNTEIERQPFQPMISGFGRPPYPPALEDISDEATEFYARLANECTDDLLKARFAHVVWARQSKGNFEFAVMADKAYLKLLGRSSRDLIYRVQDLMYGYDLAISLGNSDLINSWGEKVKTWVPALLDDPDASPGAILGSLGFLISLRNEFWPDFLDALCEQAYSKFTEPFLRQEIINMRAIVNPPTRRAEFGEQSVRLWREEANATDGLVKAHHLKTALENAQAWGLYDQEEAVLLEIANLDLRPFMSPVTASTTIPKEQFDAWIQQFTNFEDWQDCLLFIGNYCPIWHTREEAGVEAQKLIDEFPFSSHVSRMLVAHDGVPTVALSDSDKLAGKINQSETFYIGTFGHFLLLIYEDFFRKWTPTAEELFSFFHSDVIPKSAALSFAKGFIHFQNKDWESALMVSLPRLEETLRGFSRLNGLRTLKSRGGILDNRNLNELISDYLRYSEDNLFRYLELLLVHRQGLNLRNEALHGLTEPAGPRDGALALHAALSLRARLLRPKHQDSDPIGRDSQE